MIIQQSSNQDSLIMDCFAGSGSTLLAAEQTGRKWIGVDQSKYSAKVVRERFNNVKFDYIDFSKITDKVIKNDNVVIDPTNSEIKILKSVTQTKLTI